jgi:hypothetical protein
VLLIYAAGYVPYRILSWLVLGLGWLFVLVMFPPALVMFWSPDRVLIEFDGPEKTAAGPAST